MDELARPHDTLDGYCLAEEVIHALACGGLEEGQRSQALAHLDDCELCQALLADEVRALPHAPSADDANMPTLIQLEALVAGRYRIKRFVARGGMGEVYAAWDTLLAERVALKTINPVATSADQSKASARFRQEVQLSRRVADPHVCRIYEFGQHQVRGFGALSYLTMEFIEGQTLGARLRQGQRLPLGEVVELGRQMLRGLGAAHAVGVLHRDFKSDNVMLRDRQQGGGLDAVIMDFGLARLLGEQAHRLTERHELVGSAAYMAPEQLEEGAALSESTDIYAFGVVLFEMLTGRLPFEGKSAVAVALRRLTQPAPPPSLHVPELSAEWDALVLRCLEREQLRRYASTADVVRALDALTRAPAVAGPPRPWHRRRLALALGSGAALVGAASYLLASHDSAGSTPTRRGPEVHVVTPALEPRPAPAPLPEPTPTLELTPATVAVDPSPAVAPAAVTPLASEPLPPAVAHAPARAAVGKGRARAATVPAPAAPAPADAKAAHAAPDVRELFFLEAPSERAPQKSER